MMRVAVQNPHLGGIAGAKAMHTWGIAFMKRYRPWIYLSERGQLGPYVDWLRRHGLVRWGFKVVVGATLLNHLADVLVCFNGRPEQPLNCPDRRFRGFKAAHVMDYSSWASRAHAALVTAGVDYVLGYADHGRWDGFFAALFPRYVDRVIAVPFGFHERFVARRAFLERTAKCVALGSVNPVREPRAEAGELDDYAAHFAHEEYAHRFRRMLRDHETELADVMTSRLPRPPESKDFGYDIVAEYNSYRMFTTCESIMFYPSVKTFEGCAAGSVLVCSDHPCFDALGFIDGVNCIRHRQDDVDDFRDRVAHYVKREAELQAIQEAGTTLVRTRYSADAVAQALHTDLARRWQGS